MTGTPSQLHIRPLMAHRAYAAERLLKGDSRVANVMVGPGSPEHPHDHRSQHERAGQQAECLGVERSIAHEATLGRRLTIVHGPRGAIPFSSPHGGDRWAKDCADLSQETGPDADRLSAGDLAHEGEKLRLLGAAEWGQEARLHLGHDRLEFCKPSDSAPSHGDDVAATV